MTNSIVDEAKRSVKQNKKEARAMKNKPILETIKTITITVLITAIIGFIGGVYYQKTITNEINQRIEDSVSLSQSKE